MLLAGNLPLDRQPFLNRRILVPSCFNISIDVIWHVLIDVYIVSAECEVKIADGREMSGGRFCGLQPTAPQQERCHAINAFLHFFVNYYIHYSK